MVLVGKKALLFQVSTVLDNGEIVDNYNFAKAISDK